MAKYVRKTLDATDHPIGQAGDVTMPVTGVATLDKPDIQVIDGPRAQDKAAQLAFMEELITVQVHDSGDRQAKQIVEVWNDGVPQRFIRGRPQDVKRKFVEVLARAKPESFRNVEYIDADGNQSVKWPKQAGLEYPFSVIRDDNPNGPAWLRKILAEA